MDAGIATAANLAWLRTAGYDWITVRRVARKAPPARAPDPDCEFLTRCGLQARAWKLAEEREPEGAAGHAEEQETRICIWSEQRQKKEDTILAGKRCTKRYDKVIEKLGRLKERYRLVAAHYDIAVERAADTVVQRTGRRGGQPRPVHALRRRLAQRGINDSWWTIRNKLAGWERVTSTLRTVSGRLIENRQDTRPRTEAALIARAAGVEPSDSQSGRTSGRDWLGHRFSKRQSQCGGPCKPRAVGMGQCFGWRPGKLVP